MEPQRVSWVDAEPSRFARERDVMALVAPEMCWDDDLGAWNGLVPVWPFERPVPSELLAFRCGRRLHACVLYSPAFPMVAPVIFPISPEPDLAVRTRHDWHVNGDGSLCLLQGPAAWDGTGTAADLVMKAAGWFLEFLLLERGSVDAMSEAGIVNNSSRDGLFVPFEQAD